MVFWKCRGKKPSFFDRIIGKTTRTLNKEHIIQMSMSNRVKKLSEHLYNDFNFKTSIHNKSDADILKYLEQNIANKSARFFERQDCKRMNIKNSDNSSLIRMFLIVAKKIQLYLQ